MKYKVLRTNVWKGDWNKVFVSSLTSPFLVTIVLCRVNGPVVAFAKFYIIFVCENKYVLDMRYTGKVSNESRFHRL